MYPLLRQAFFRLLAQKFVDDVAGHADRQRRLVNLGPLLAIWGVPALSLNLLGHLGAALVALSLNFQPESVLADRLLLEQRNA
jgi:hypothetical protein